MKASRNYFFVNFCLFAALITSALSVSAQSGNTRPRVSPSQVATGQSTVTGRVTYKDNDQPLPGSRVRIFTTADAGVVAFTNQRGEFRVDGLAAGKYYVALEGPGVAMQSGMGVRLPIPIAAIPRKEDFAEVIPKHDAHFTVDGTNSVEVEVRVARGGSLSGKVLKANGAPVAGIGVSFLSRDAQGMPYTARFSAQTDKDGAYKIENLPEGDYIVAVATGDNAANLDIRARMRGEGQVVTYHPAASLISEAQSVRVDPGRETAGVNVTLVARSGFAVSGTVLRQRDGTPVVNATVVLRSKDAEAVGGLVPGMSQRRTQTDSEGRWTFNSVLDGSYVVTALAPSDPGAVGPGQTRDREALFRQSRQRFLIAQQDLNVAGADLSGLLMSITGPGSVVGRVETDNGTPLPENLVLFFELISASSRPGPPLPVRVSPDGTFSFGNIQGGDVYLGFTFSPNSRYFVKSVDAGGFDPKSSPLRVSEGTEAGPVRIVISLGAAVLTGRVLPNTSGSNVGDLVVLLAPVESAKQRFRTAYPSTRTGEDGSFSVTAPPGEYFVLARPREELPAIVSEQFVQAAAGKATRVTLAAGEQKRLDLRAE